MFDSLEKYLDLLCWTACFTIALILIYFEILIILETFQLEDTAVVFFVFFCSFWLVRRSLMGADILNLAESRSKSRLKRVRAIFVRILHFHPKQLNPDKKVIEISTERCLSERWVVHTQIYETKRTKKKSWYIFSYYRSNMYLGFCVFHSFSILFCKQPFEFHCRFKANSLNVSVNVLYGYVVHTYFHVVLAVFLLATRRFRTFS